MADIKLGIIGYGFMGHEHANMMETIDEIDLVAVCDTVMSQMDDAPGSVRKYACMDKLLEDEEINTVIISIPNPLHLEAVVKAAKAGKNIICEKPAAMSVEEFDEMCKITRECNVGFTIHQQRRWDADFRTIKEVYDRHLVGKEYLVKSQLYGFNGNMHDWHIYPEMGGGMLYDWGVHLIDQILLMIDSRLVSVYADMKNVINKNVDDYFNILFTFENGITAEIELGTYYLTPKRAWFLGGTTGSAVIDGPFQAQGNVDGMIVRTKHLLENVPGKITMTAAGPTRSFGEPEPGLIYNEDLPKVDCCHKDFFMTYINAFYGKEESAVKLTEVRKVLCVMDAVRESAKRHQAVLFE